MDPASPEGRYLAWARLQGAADPAAVAWRPGQTGDWHFFFTKGAPGQKLHPAAVGAAVVVAPGPPDGWLALLQSAPAPEVQERVAWLHGMWASLAPGTPFADSVVQKHPKVAPHLTPADLARDGDGVTFTAWYAEPPSMLPFRLTLRATADTVTVERAPLSKLAP